MGLQTCEHSIPSLRLPSTNGRRGIASRAALEGLFEVSSHEVHNYHEPTGADTKETAYDKILRFLERRLAQPNEWLLSNDLMNHIYLPPHIASTDQETHDWYALRKPRDPQQLQTYFDVLSTVAVDGKAIMSNSGHTILALTDETGANASFHDFPMESRLTLNVERMHELAGDKLLSKWYQEKFMEFYENKFSYTKVSGFCVLLMAALGCVEMIDGVRLWEDDAEKVKEAIYGLVYTATNTLSPLALQFVAEQAQQAHIPLQTILDRLMALTDTNALSERVFDWFWQRRLEQPTQVR